MKGPALFQGEIITKLQIYIDKNLKIFFSRTTGSISNKLGTDHLSVKGIQVCSKERPRLFPRGDNYKIAKIHDKILKISFFKTTGSILRTKHPWVKVIQVCSNEMPRPFPRGNIYEILKIHWQNFKIFFSITNGPISTKLGTKHLLVKVFQVSMKLGTKYSWVKGIQVCSNERPHPFPRGDNYKIVKIHWQNLKIFFSRTNGPISTKLGTKSPWVKGIQVCANERPCPFRRGDNYKIAKNTSMKFKIKIKMCLLIWAIFSGERCGPWASCYCWIGHLYFGFFRA